MPVPRTHSSTPAAHIVWWFQRLMLAIAYQRERATNITGIYVGTAESGELHTVLSSRPL